MSSSEEEKSDNSKIIDKSVEREKDKDESSRLDIFSPNFDPSAFIYSSDLTVPTPSAPIHDNVEQFVSKVQNASKKVDNKSKSEKSKSVSDDVKLERRFLPEQMPIQSQRKALPNLFRFMDKQMNADKGGPLSVLARCIRSGERIRVHVRGINKIRGIAIGTLVAFDKHWNLALVDVDETFTRKRFPKTSLFDVEKISRQFDEMNVDRKASTSRSRSGKKPRTVVKREQVGCSITQIVKTRHKTELCERHVPQVVLRGEHVALVQILA